MQQAGEIFGLSATGHELKEALQGAFRNRLVRNRDRTCEGRHHKRAEQRGGKPGAKRRHGGIEQQGKVAQNVVNMIIS
ncbi:hypothetical protein B0G71_7785 [Paraburkholderia sp. BL27I4N3]|uniref:hypothetical protein n=1 Tax=Paraburkholderia sp. BL27I4N3 TaxID=1938805 RepID=UPI000E386B0D|nr:hypothetical protein [Paraburkholderia sp. BL27I4N3]REE07297.1 hypothetical protein B0G71_7785 [Paraburkholderia sp. BL27I4N3]